MDSMEIKINIILLTGFLGSGKTTFLKALISYFSASSIRFAVLMNEFGEIDIDGQILGEKDYEYKEIAGGSIFCSCKHDQFIETVLFLLSKNPEFLIIESSGIADPFQFYSDLKIISNTAEGKKIESFGAIGIFDASNFLELYETTQTLKRQIAFSNVILINKIDIANPDRIEEIIQIITTINKDGTFYKTAYCTLQNQTFQEIISQFKNQNQKFCLEAIEKMRIFNLTKPEDAPERIILQIPKNNSENVKNPRLDAVLSFLKELIPITYRIKGYLTLDEGTVLFNCVQNRIEWKIVKEKIEQEGIVVIFREKIDYVIADSVKEKWNELFG